MQYTKEGYELDQLERIRWLVKLHWVAVIGFFLVALLAYRLQARLFQVLLWLPVVPAVYNGLIALYLRKHETEIRAGHKPKKLLPAIVHSQLGIDLAVATVGIHLTGGIESILVPVYLVIVPGTALLVSRQASYAYATTSLVLLGAVSGGEYAGLLPHRHPYPGPELYRQHWFVATYLAINACFLYLGAHITGHVVSKLRAQRRQLVQLQELGESIVDAIGQGIVVLDARGNIVHFNQFMRDTYGWTDDNLNDNVFESLPDLQEAGLREHFERIITEGKTSEVHNLHRVTLHGKEAYQNLRGYPLYRNGEVDGAVVVIQDVTDHTRLEHDLQQQLARRETIAQLSRRISSILEPNQLLQETVDLVADTFDFYNVAIFLVDEGSDELVLRAEVARRNTHLVDNYRQAIGEGMIGWVAQTGESLLSNDVREEPHYLSFLPETLSEVVVPLKYRDQVLGVLDAQSDEVNAFEQEDVATLQILADQVAVAIENARLYAAQEGAEQTLRRRAEELSVLHQTALAGAQATDSDDLIERITQILASTIYQENVGFLFVAPQGEELHPHPSYYGVTPELREITIPLGTGISGTVAQSGEPLLVPDVREDRRYIPVSSTVQSELCVPVRVEGDVAGVINVESPEVDGFTREDVHLVSTVAGHVGTALEKLRLFEETRRRNQELAARNAITHAVSRSLDIDSVLHRLYREVKRLLVLDAFFVALYDPSDESFTVALAVEEGERIPRFSATVDETGGLTAWVIKEAMPLLVRDLPAETDDLPANPQHLTEPARSWLGVPLITRGRLVGVLSIQSFDPYAFDEHDKEFLSAVADQVALAIENARLYEETRRMAYTDGLTGLYNSRHFYRALGKELARSKRYEHPLSLIMLDLDDFKKYNDRYGHLAGDDLLKELANLLTDVIRRTDVAARYGGEEFSIILPETDAADALEMAERILAAVEEHRFEVHDGQTVGRTTVSAGVAAYPEHASNVKELVNCADMALLRAKIEKNQVCLYERD